MYKKDQQKGIIALILFGSIAISYFLFGKPVAKIVALIGFALWLLNMFFINKQDK